MEEFRWHSELLNWRDMVGDPMMCAFGVCAPSFLFGRNVTRITDGGTSFWKAAFDHLARGGCCCWCCCLPYYSAPFRAELRKKRNLAADPYDDLHTHMYCHPCAICQEARELDVTAKTVVTGPKHPVIDRDEDRTRKHLEDVQMQNMQK